MCRNWNSHSLLMEMQNCTTSLFFIHFNELISQVIIVLYSNINKILLMHISTTSIAPLSFSLFSAFLPGVIFLLLNNSLQYFSQYKASGDKVSVFGCLEMYLFCLHFYRIFSAYINPGLQFSLHTSYNSFHCLLASIVSVKKSVINLIVYMTFVTPDF